MKPERPVEQMDIRQHPRITELVEKYGDLPPTTPSPASALLVALVAAGLGIGLALLALRFLR